MGELFDQVLGLMVALGVGVGLAAACGLRVFLPLLVAGIGTRLGLVNAPDALAWIGTWPALVALAVASGVEVGGYYIPWVDNALDAVATPLAAGAGMMTGALALGAPLAGILMGPEHAAEGSLLAWAGPLIAGGVAVGAGAAVATGVQTTTVAARGTSSVTTLGVANPLIATVENVGAVVLSVVAVVVPALVALLLLMVVIGAVMYGRRRARRSKAGVLATAG